jgi:hypothetical protein
MDLIFDTALSSTHIFTIFYQCLNTSPPIQQSFLT